MGCARSKHRNRCRNCRGGGGGGLSPVIVPRSYSMHVHHPAQHNGDSYHTVALTSSTIGSLGLCDSSSSLRHFHKHLEDEDNDIKVRELSERKMDSDLEAKVIEAKVWSSMMKEKIPKVVPKTPIVTPPGEPEMINTWELMEGLEDVVSPLRSPNHLKSFSFDVDLPKSRFHSIVDDLDPPEIVSTFRKSLQQVPTEHPFHIRIPEMNPNPQFGSSDEEKEEGRNCKRESLTLGKEKVILYFTSLRGIRKTYEDCCNIRIILKSLGIRVDERDVSMHSGFKDELKMRLEDKFNNGVGITLPRVFLGDKYLGGVEEIKMKMEHLKSLSEAAKGSKMD